MSAQTFVALFVYGTLRQGECNDLRGAAASHELPAPVWRGTGELAGGLVDFGGWPGMVSGADARLPASLAAGIVRGEVYRIDARLLPLIDAIEGYDPTAPLRPTCFVRRAARVAVAGVDHDCQFYPVDPAFAVGKPPIPGGDWVAYRRVRDLGGTAAPTSPDGAFPSETRRP